MAVEIKMPKLSQTTEDVRFIKWLVREGDSIKKGDFICEVENDKTTMEVESFESGTVLKLYAGPEEVIAAGTLIAVIGQPGEKIPEIAVKREKDETKYIQKEDKTVKNTARTEISVQETVSRPYEDISATNLVKNMAKKRDIDLALVKGTGPKGLITKKDLERYMMSKAKEGINEYNLSRNQVFVARNLMRSKAEIPHYYLKCSIFTDNLFKWREDNRLSDETKVSVYSLFIYAAAKVLKEFPRMNGYFKENKVVLFNNINVGFAVTAGEELYVPVVKDADKKTIIEIDREVKQMVEKAKNERLEPEDIKGGTFTITNLGIYHVDEFCAIINPPQAGILAIGQMKKTLYIDDNDATHIKNVCTVTGSFDHRFINGAKGAAFLERYKKIIEEEIL